MLGTHSAFDKVISVCAAYSAERESENAQGGSGRKDLRSYLVQVANDDQATLLRNLLEYEIRNRRKAGEVPTAKEYIEMLPEHDGLIRRLFLDVSSASMSEGQIAAADMETGRQPLVASRLGEYRLMRELGRGGMGAVFEAIHLTRGHRVALKTLPAVSGESLHRFKREFRALADVTHPNLVGLRTLENDGGQWFITLDLLEGTNFLEYVRPSGILNLARLRDALAQLAAGLMALHARGIVHRDLKPGNVMVTHQGRVIILDFGLVSELDRAGVYSATGLVAGTPAYMAPEQAAGGQVGPPADWYAFGGMLYEALAGRRPFQGDALRVLQEKQHSDAPPLTLKKQSTTEKQTPADQQIAADQQTVAERQTAAPQLATSDMSLPTDLADLCMKLLAREPSDRPDPLHIAGVVASAIPEMRSHESTSDVLVGRESQTAALAEALKIFRRSQSPVTVFIKGRSGEGKTSLAESFLSVLRSDPSLVVMSGRCYDRESVPFKALDTIIDALTGHLRTLPDAAAALLLPDDIGLLAEVFPVLRRCDIVAQAPRGRLDALDQQQVRQRAFAALRLLMDRIGQKTPLVWFVDDLQWGDTDSAGALFEILRPPAAPSVLFLGSFRSDEADSSPFLTEWTERQEDNGVSFGDRLISVGPLSLEDATQLVINVVGRNDEVVRRRAVQFHAQAGGNPFLLVELAGCFDPDEDAFHTTDIHGVLARKLGQLPEEAQLLLDAVSVSGQAVHLSEVVAAAGIKESPEQTLTRMRNVRLLRVVGDKVDTYHDRIRYAILDRLEPDSRRNIHRRLAEVIEQTEGGLTAEDLNRLVDGSDKLHNRGATARIYDLAFHYDSCGDQKKALAYSLVAARQARAQFAIDVASQQYVIAQRNSDTAPKDVQFRIARGNGEALMQLGRYDDSKKELDRAFQLAKESYDIADARGLQSELALKLGLILQSIEYSIEALRHVGVKVPRTPPGLWWGLVFESIVQTIHCCVPWSKRTREPNRHIDLANHLLGKLCYAYYCHNVLYLLWASLAGLNRAERLPPSAALAFNYVVHANDMAVLGWHSRADRYYASAMELSTRLNDQWGAAHAMNHSSLGSLGAARFEDTIQKAIPGTIAFSKLGDLLEEHFAHFSIGMSQYGLGNLNEALQKAKWIFDSCVRHGDNVFGPMALCLWARASRGQLPVDELVGCLDILPGNNLASICVLMTEGYWHLHHKRTGDAVRAFEQAWQISWKNSYIVTYNSWVLSDYAMALRLHFESDNASGAEGNGEAERAVQRRQWMRIAKWANRLSLVLPPERPRALRELALAYADHGNLKKAWKLANQSCRKAEETKAAYEYAKSLLVTGQVGLKLDRPESQQQIQQALTQLSQIEMAP
ncbi:MAG: protein kinase [Planctomyces sp.]|nr:protein kinase [Planctomyces sp.]